MSERKAFLESMRTSMDAEQRTIAKITAIKGLTDLANQLITDDPAIEFSGKMMDLELEQGKARLALAEEYFLLIEKAELVKDEQSKR